MLLNNENDHQPTEFEIHFTVPGTVRRENFQYICERVGVKPILIDYTSALADKEPDMMTSSTFLGTRYDLAQSIIPSLRNDIEGWGIEITRVKIEMDPKGPGVPRDDDYIRTHAGLYFESHFLIQGDGDLFSELRKSVTVVRDRLHISKNLFKKEDDLKSLFLTYRRYDLGRTNYERVINFVTDSLHKEAWTIRKRIDEYCIWDSDYKSDGY